MVMMNIFSSTTAAINIKPPKPDFTAYCHDFAKQESAYIDSDALTTHFGFSFADLFDQTIARNKGMLSALQSCPYCIIAHAGPEYDPGYSHVGVYLKNQHAFMGEMIDVISQDASILSLAFHLLSRFFQSGSADRGAVIFFEQPVIPILKNSHHVLKNQSRVDVFLSNAP